MLTELSGLQESEESVWGAAQVSFNISTRSEGDGELIEREYTFSHAKEWDKWTFSEFEERRTKDVNSVSGRNWRRSAHVHWNDAEAPSVDVPPEVTEKLKELLEVEELTLQKP